MSSSERIPAAAAYETFRDTPYKTDKALAELVDNSIQAGASLVDVVVVEKLFTQKREVARVNEIYVIDNGKGMSPDILTKSLEFLMVKIAMTLMELENSVGVCRFNIASMSKG